MFVIALVIDLKRMEKVLLKEEFDNDVENRPEKVVPDNSLLPDFDLGVEMLRSASVKSFRD